jgi:2-polyprenyl-3-methyl-5-hydroxy-6-metoxy-1,4-benzoquinol methylase
MSTDDLAGLIPYLQCPRCGKGVATAGENSLRCANEHLWPLIDGIPRFTSPSSYADSFGYQWTTFPQTQLDNNVRTESEKTFSVKTGLSPEDVEGQSVLDVGCGMGRFSDVVARWGAETIVAMDLSRAVEAAKENLAGYSGAHVIQGDASNPPIAQGSFDVVFSIGVLHHTPSTAKSLAAAAKLVKPGGVFAVWL